MSEVTKGQEHVVNESPDQQEQSLRPVRLRAILVGIACIVMVAFSEARWFLQEPYLDFHFMPPAGAVAFLFVLMGLNLLIKRVGKLTPVFSRRDILLIYSMVMMAGVILSHGLMQVFPGMIVNVAIKALDMPKYWQPYSAKMPSILIPQNEDTIWQFFEGGRSGVPWGDWIVPIITWTIFWSVVFFVLICMASILRKWWTDYERLLFPMTVLPLTVSNEDTSAEGGISWRSALLWWGIGAASILGLWGLISYFVPAFPELPNGIDLGRHFTSPPFDAIASPHFVPLRLTWNPVVIGLGYIVPLDVNFSLWFFFLMYRVVYVLIINMMGLLYTHHLPLERAHLNGAITGYGLLVIWLARGYLRRVASAMFSRRCEEDDSNEPMPYKLATWGFVIGSLLILVFVVVVLDVELWIALVYTVLLFLGAIAFARIRSESGFPANTARMYLFHYLDWAMGPGIDARGIAYLWPLETGYFDSTAELSLQAYKMGDATNTNRRSITVALFIAYFVAVIAGWLVYLPLIYEKGAYLLEPQFNNLIDMPFRDVITGERYQYANTLVYWHGGFAAIFAVFLGYMRTLFVWWPLNPVGFVLAYNDWMWMTWGPFFIAWLVKSLLLRYAGTTAYKKATAFFVGLMIGGVFWNLASTVVTMIARAF